MRKAIAVKTKIQGNEVSEDIAYLYNELAVTYKALDDLHHATVCIRKQQAIYEALKMVDTFEYVDTLSTLAEFLKEQDLLAEAITLMRKACEIEPRLIENLPNNPILETVPNLKFLGECLIADG